MAAALPEARVVALPLAGGALSPDGALAVLAPLLASAAAVLVGPGMQSGAAVAALVRGLALRLPADARCCSMRWR